MRLKAIMVLAVLALWATAADEKPAWKEHTSKDGKFKVVMPPGARKQSNTGGAVTVHTELAEGKDWAVGVAYADIPLEVDETAARIQTRLDGARDGAIRDLRAKLVAETKITLAGKYPGREFSATMPMGKGTYKARIFLVGKRLYQVISVGSKEHTDSAQVKKFFESFEVTK